MSEARLSEDPRLPDDLRRQVTDLERREDLWRTLFQQSADAVALLDGGIVVDCNAAAVELVGVESRDDLIGRSPVDLSPPRQPDGRPSREAAKANIREAMENGHARFEWVHLRADGSPFPADVMLSRTDCGDRQLVQAVFRDLTDRQALEAEQERERARARTLGDLGAVASALANESATLEEACGKILEQVCTRLDWAAGVMLVPEGHPPTLRSAGVAYIGDRQDWEGKRGEWREMRWGPDDATAESWALATKAPAWEHLPTSPSDHPSTRAALDLGLRTSFAFPVLVRDEVVAVLMFGSQRDEPDPDGDLLRVMGDIGTRLGRVVERSRAAQELADREARYRTLFHGMLDGASLHEVLVDESGEPCDYRFLDVNPAFEQFTGFRREDIVGRTVREVLPGIEEYWVENLGRVALTGEPLRLEGYAQELGKHYTVNAFCPQPGQFVATFVDTTERKAAEEALRESEERFRSLFEEMAQGVIYQRPDGSIGDANPAAERILGLTRDQLLGLTSMDPRWRMIDEKGQYIPGYDHPAMRALRTKSEIRDQVVGVCRPESDERRWLVVSAVPLFEAGETEPHAAFATFTDMTERKAMEQELAGERNLLRTIIDQLPDQIFVKDRESRFVLHNPPTGSRAPEEHRSSLVGMSDFDIMPREIAEAHYREEQRVMQTGEGFHNREVHAVHGADDEEFYLSTKLPLRDDSGQVVGLVGINHYVTEYRQMAVEVERSEARLSAILDAVPVGVSVLRDRRFEEVNEHLIRMTGYSREQLLGQATRMLYVDDETSDRMGREVYSQIRETGRAHVETQFVCADGRVLDVLIEGNPLYADEPDGAMVFAAVDLTDRKEAERKLLDMASAVEQSQARLAAILQAVPVGVAVLEDRALLEMNDYFGAMIGRELPELTGRNTRVLYPAELIYESTGREVYAQIAESGRAFAETQFIHADGRVLDVLLSGNPLDPDKPDGAVVFAVLDITDRKRAEQALRNSEELYRGAIAAAGLVPYETRFPDPCTEEGTPNQYLYMGDGIERLLGRSAESFTDEHGTVGGGNVVLRGELAGMDYKEAVAGHRRGEIELWEADYLIPLPSGETRWIADASVLICEDSKPVGSLGMLQDITDRKREEREKAAILDAISDHVVYRGPDDRIIWANRSFARACGQEPEDLVGREWPHRGDASGEPCPTSIARDRQQPHVAEVNDADGSVWAVSAYPVLDESDGVLGVVEVSRDVTQQQRDAEELRLFAQRQRLHFESTPLAIIEWDPEFRIVEWNPAAEAIFGYARQEAVGQHASLILPEHVRPHVEVVFEALMRGDGGERSTNANLRKDGATIMCEWWNTSLVSESGEVIGVASQVLDVTAQMEAEEEKRKLEESIQRTQRLESIGVLAGGIAHDFNNILAAILGYAELAQMEAQKGSQEQGRLQYILDAGHRARDLVKQILTFSRQHESEPAHIDLEPVIKESLKFLRASLPTTIEFRESIESGCGMA
ncbi:MAG: PAS domain S-box protein, partial [Armatimonadia bacterium]|nr:PAS domain S-box protein [Armatimonadia bacterium]